MTEQADILGRAQTRETATWGQWSFSDVASDVRTTAALVYGIYGQAMLDAQDAAATEKLTLIVAGFNAAYLAADADEQRMGIEIASKRYTAQIEDAIIRQGFVTKAQANAKDSAYMLAQIAALSTDRAALETRRAELASRLAEVATRIDVLTAETQEEGYRKDAVAIEVAEKQVAVDEAELRLLQVAIDAAEIRLRINGAALDSAQVAVDVAEAGAKLAELGNATTFLAADIADMQNRVTAQGRALTGESIQQQMIAARSTDLTWEQFQADLEALGVDTATIDAAGELQRVAFDTAAMTDRKADVDVADGMLAADAASMGAQTLVQAHQQALQGKQVAAELNAATVAADAATEDYAQAGHRVAIAGDETAQTATEEATQGTLAGAEAAANVLKATERTTRYAQAIAETAWLQSKLARTAQESTARRNLAWSRARRTLMGVSVAIQRAIAAQSQDYEVTTKQAIAAHRLQQWITTVLARIQADVTNEVAGAKDEAQGIADRAAGLIGG